VCYTSFNIENYIKKPFLFGGRLFDVNEHNNVVRRESFMENKLTGKQERFVKEYVKDFNGSRAAIAAGYSKDTARVIASELLTKPNICDAVQRAAEKMTKKIEITQERIAEELSKIAFSDIKEFIEFNSKAVKIKDSKDVDGAVIQEVSSHTGLRGTSTKLKLHDKMKALELLGRYKGMYKDVVIIPKEAEKLSLEELEELENASKTNNDNQSNQEHTQDIEST
jgi:phage terminase small subunit